MTFRLLAIFCLMLSACSAAADIEASDSLTTIPLFDPTTTSVATSLDSTSVTTMSSSTDGETTTTDEGAETTGAPTIAVSTTEVATTAAGGPTTTAVDPNAAFCQAASRIVDLGASVDLDDKAAAAVFFDEQAERWADAVPVAPFTIAADVSSVATFVDGLRNLMVENDYDLFVVFEEATALEVQLGSDNARIRSNQFIYATCPVEPPTAEEATAAFYGSLLGTAEDREGLIEILASAEVFPLDGARCFVERASVDVMHPLVGAPSTPDQDNAFSDLLTTCQLTLGAQQ